MKIIDVHPHTVPQIYADALQSRVIRNPDGFTMPEWSVEEHLGMTERRDIQA